MVALRRSLIALTAVEWLGAAEGSPLRFAHNYGSNMVLQRAPQQAQVWGYAAPGADITVGVRDSAANSAVHFEQVSADPTGVWRATLSPVSGSSKSYSVRVEDSVSGESAELTDVLFGDVWLCSGQSNMAFLLEMDLNGTELVKDADNWPDIRLFTSKKVQAVEPSMEQAEVEQPWSVGSSCSVSQNCGGRLGAVADVGDDNWLYMSAVCWLYGREIAKETGLPVGLVNTNWGGTAIELWSSADARSVCPDAGPTSLNGKIYNGMVQPLLNMTIFGAIWYQGESNAGDRYDFHGGPTGQDLLPSYACRFPAMIADWRQKWHEGTRGLTDPEFPFGFVQLASEKTGQMPKAGIRWAQSAGYGFVPNERMPNTFMAIAADLTDDDSPFGAVHIRHKQEVGRRLGLAGRATVYGADVEWRGPLNSGVVQQDGVATVSFDQDVTVSVSQDVQWEICREGSSCPLDSVDGWEHAMSEVVSSNSISLSANSSAFMETSPVLPVVAVRYAWRDRACGYQGCDIYGKDGLPASPFFARVSGAAAESALLV